MRNGVVVYHFKELEFRYNNRDASGRASLHLSCSLF